MMIKMNDLDINNAFDGIKHTDEDGKDFWYARELSRVLNYREYRNFVPIINKAKVACNNSQQIIDDHFVQVHEMIKLGKGGQRKVTDFKLSRYACYLIVQNADAKKRIVAIGQTYFAVQTRKQELLEKEYSKLSEDEKRFYNRELTKKGNYSLNQTARNAGVRNFDKFHNYGYKGLYGGETANDIAKRKGLRYREDILDNMGSVELAANLFRITQTEEKLRNKNILGENNANMVHYNMGKDIRNFIASQGGTMPEELPTPSKSLKELERENKVINYDDKDE